VGVTRREFFRIAGAVTVAATIGGTLFDKLFVPAHSAPRAVSPQDRVAFTGCFCCLGRCTLQVQVAPGDVPRFVTGDIEGPVNEGSVCALGAGSPLHYLSPARLRAPLLRKPDAERGEGKFVRIRWDDMMDILLDGDDAPFLKRRGWRYGFLGLKTIREKFPEKFVYFTGRDQYNPTENGFFAAVFGTPNQGAHGGFCSVNVAAGGCYVAGGTWWEYGGVDPHHSRLVVLSGVAQDHFPNGTRRLLTKIRSQGGRFVYISPDRFPNLGPLVDQWIPIRPGTDGALVMGLMHELLRLHREGMAQVPPEPYIDEEYLRWYTNAPYLVITNPDGTIDPPASANVGLFARVRNAKGEWVPAIMGTDGVVHPFNEVPWQKGVAPDLQFSGEVTVPLSPEAPTAVALRVSTAFRLLAARLGEDAWAAEKVADVTGVDAATIRQFAKDLGDTAMRQAVWVPGRWTDYLGRSFEGFVGRPVGIYIMRGVAAHSNGFQTARDYMILLALLGAIDAPGGWRYKTPAPWPIPDGDYWPGYATPVDPRQRQKSGVVGGTTVQERILNDGTVIATAVRGRTPAIGGTTKPFIYTPDQLVVDEHGRPLLIDRAYSWDAPFAVHRIFTAVNYDAGTQFPYRVEFLLWHICNPYWDNSYDLDEDLALVRQKHDDGRHVIPFVAIVDTFYGHSVPYADLVIPDLTFFERYGVHSLLDRPISTVDGPADSIHWPVLPPLYGVKSWADTLLQVAERLRIPAVLNPDGSAKYPRGYEDFIWKWELVPGSGIGLLAGARGDGTQVLKGKPNPTQVEAYTAPGYLAAFGDHAQQATYPGPRKVAVTNGALPAGVAPGQQTVGHAHFQYTLPVEIRYRRNVNAGYLQWAHSVGLIPYAKPVPVQLYSEIVQKFRLAGHGKWKGANAYFLWRAKEAAAVHRDQEARFYQDLAARSAHPPSDARGQALRKILTHLYDPLPTWYEPLEWAADGSPADRYPLRTEARHVNPWFYHTWQNHNPWHRPMLLFSPLYMNTETARRYGIESGDWVEFESRRGEKLRAMVEVTEATRPDVVWYWKGRNVRPGTMAIAPDSPEVRKGIMFNDVYAYQRPRSWGGELAAPPGSGLLNLDPFTGQTCWGDLRLRVVGKSSVQESAYGAVDALLKAVASRDFMPAADTIRVFRFSAYKPPAQAGITWYERKK